MLTGAMLGFPGEDYTTPQIIQETGGFGPVDLTGRASRTLAMGRRPHASAGALRPDAARRVHSRAGLRRAQRRFWKPWRRLPGLRTSRRCTLAFETGQETAELLRETLDELDIPNIKVNFDPANMLLYDMGDPIEAIELLGPDIRSVHVKDAKRPKTKGQWGEEVPLGKGEVDIPLLHRDLEAVRLHRAPWPSNARSATRRLG